MQQKSVNRTLEPNVNSELMRIWKIDGKKLLRSWKFLEIMQRRGSDLNWLRFCLMNSWKHAEHFHLYAGYFTAVAHNINVDCFGQLFRYSRWVSPIPRTSPFMLITPHGLSTVPVSFSRMNVSVRRSTAFSTWNKSFKFRERPKIPKLRDAKSDIQIWF